MNGYRGTFATPRPAGPRGPSRSPFSRWRFHGQGAARSPRRPKTSPSVPAFFDQGRERRGARARGGLTRSLQKLAERDPDMLVWWGSKIECASALAGLERPGALDQKRAALAFDRLAELADGWHEIEPSEIVRESAVRFLRVHTLRPADALELGAAFAVAEKGRPSLLQALTLDERLADAALVAATGVLTARRVERPSDLSHKFNAN